MTIELSPETIDAIARRVVELLEEKISKRKPLSADYYTPNQIAKSRGCDVSKILNWISKGELKAVNYASKRSGRPRWKISAAALQDFERLREALPPMKRQSRRSESSLPPVEKFV